MTDLTATDRQQFMWSSCLFEGRNIYSKLNALEDQENVKRLFTHDFLILKSNHNHTPMHCISLEDDGWIILVMINIMFNMILITDHRNPI